MAIRRRLNVIGKKLELALRESRVNCTQKLRTRNLLTKEIIENENCLAKMIFKQRSRLGTNADYALTFDRMCRVQERLVELGAQLTLSIVECEVYLEHSRRSTKRQDKWRELYRRSRRTREL